jgi:hypothetical protein
VSRGSLRRSRRASVSPLSRSSHPRNWWFLQSRSISRFRVEVSTRPRRRLTLPALATNQIIGLSTTVAFAPGQPTGWLTAQLNSTTTPASVTVSAFVDPWRRALTPQQSLSVSTSIGRHKRSRLLSPVTFTVPGPTGTTGRLAFQNSTPRSNAHYAQPWDATVRVAILDDNGNVVTSANRSGGADTRGQPGRRDSNRRERIGCERKSRNSLIFACGCKALSPT